jgi:hypothetical protein
MPVFGEYETVGEPIAVTEERGRISSVWQARKTGGGEARLYVVKTYRALRDEGPLSESQPDEPLAHDPHKEFIAGIKQLKKAQREGGHCLSPVYAFGIHPEEGGWYVTDFYPGKSLKEWVTRRGRVDDTGLRHVIHSIAVGCLALKRARGFSHGNLKPSNVFLLGKPRPLNQRPMVLADPNPAAPLQLAGLEGADRAEALELLGLTMQAHDLRAIGELILQLVQGRLVQSAYDYTFPVSPSTEWDRLGNKGELWRTVCNRLLDPKLSPEKETLEKLEAEFRPDWKTWVEIHKTPLIFAGGAFCVLIATTYLLWPKPPSSLTITVASQKRPYGTPNPPFNVELNQKVWGVKISAYTTADEASPVGEYEIEVAIADPKKRLRSCNIITNTEKLIIEKVALTVKAHNQKRSYGAPNPPLTGEFTGSRRGDAIAPLYTTAATSDSPAGDYPIAAGLNDPSNKLGNYNVTTNNGTLTITKLDLSLTAANPVRFEGEPNPTSLGSVSGLRPSDKMVVSFNTEANVNSPAGTYKISPAYEDPEKKAGNYNVIINPGTLTVRSRARAALPVLTLSASNQTRIYGMPNPPLNGSIRSSKLGESISITNLLLTTKATESSPVGPYDILPQLAVPGRWTSNYNVVALSATLTIKPREMTIAPQPVRRVYGTPNPKLMGNIQGLLPDDAIEVSFSTMATTNSRVGSYDIVHSMSDPRARRTNYSVQVQQAKLEVTPAPLTITVESANRLANETNPEPKGTITGLVNGDKIGLAGFRTVAASNSPPGSYDIVPILNDPAGLLANYLPQTNSGKLVVMARIARPPVTPPPTNPIPPVKPLTPGEIRHDVLGIKGFDFALESGVGRNQAGAYVAVNELSWAEYLSLCSRFDVAPKAAAPNQAQGNPAPFASYEEAVSFLNQINASPKLGSQSKLRLPTLDEYAALSGLTLAANWLPAAGEITALRDAGENVAKGNANSVAAAGAGPARKGLHNLIGNAPEWFDKDKSFGVSYLADTTSDNSRLIVKQSSGGDFLKRRRSGEVITIRPVFDAGQ